jgi:hypothetical protein
MSDSTIRLSAGQLEEMEESYRTDFLLETVCDWFALFEAIYRRPATLPFEQAMEMAGELAQRLETCPQFPEEDASYELIHRALLATEQGAEPNRLHGAIESFISALPAHEAGFALFSSLLRPGA